MAKSPLEARVIARLGQEATATGGQGLSPLEQRIAARLGASSVGAPQLEPSGPGFFRRVGNFFLDPDFVEARAQGLTNTEALRADFNKGAFSPGDVLQMRSVALGVISPTLKGAEAITQIPGLFTQRDLPTDRAAEWINRFEAGLVKGNEQAALNAGVSPQGIADAHLAGELVGYMLPVTASLKAARLVTGIRGGSVISLQRNLKLDTVAGMIFGSSLVPEEELAQRVVNTSRESAIFGLGGLMINGLVFAATGMKFARATQLQKEADLLEKLKRINGGEIVVLEQEGVTVARLLSEEGYLASSPEAQGFLAQFEIDNALIAGIRGSAEAGMSRGFARDVTKTFPEAAAVVDRYRAAFPALKFDPVKNPRGGFDIHFGLTGLNNSQKGQLAREGRYAGQIVQKGGSIYSYVRRAEDGTSLIVRTIDNKTVRLQPSGVTDLPSAFEDIPLPSTGQALYSDFREFFFGRTRAAAAEAGGLAEEDIIRFIRQNQLGFDDTATRSFESGGAITHPSEVGIAPGAGAMSVEEFAEVFAREGAQGAGLLDPYPIRRFDDVFEAWLKERGLTPDATDIEAFRANFNARMREDIWALTPKADIETMQAIRSETLALAEKEGVPFAALANEKGFHVERLPDGRVSLRDINTGARLDFGDEAFAREALPFVVRSEKDPLFEFVTPGNHGVPGFTGGFDPFESNFTFDVNIAPGEFLPHLPAQSITNTRDFLVAMEDLSGVPVFNEGFALIDEAVVRQRNRLEVIGNEIAAIWKRIPRRDRKAAAAFWTSTEGSQLAGTALVRRAQAAGLSGKQITAIQEARTMMDLGAQQRGMPESRFMSSYYGRIKPEAERLGRPLEMEEILRLVGDDPIAVQEFRGWQEMTRSGELPHIEADPEIVMHKYFRSLTYAQEVRPLEQRVRQMMNTRIQDLPATNQRNIMARSLPGTTLESHVFPSEVRGMLKEYLNNVRGDSNSAFESARRFTTRAFEMVGIKADPKLFDELHSTLLSAQYGAAIGLRLTLMNRNATQNLWTMYTRVGARYGSESLALSMSQEGFDQALRAGAIRSTQVSVPSGDAIFRKWFTPEIAQGSGPLSNAAAAMIRLGVRTGRLSRDVAQKFLIPYGSGDQVNRAWAFHWQRLHTQDHLARFDAGRIGWDKFLDDGLPFFSDSIKRGFRARFDKFGREVALDWIGKQAADEAHFIYGAASTPQWMQRPFGRLFGVFGQWPLWAKQLYVNRMAHATPRQKAAFWARSAALGGVFTNMSLQTGVNMWSWMAPLSIQYSGGPAVDMALTAREIWSGPLDNKANATKRLAEQIGSLALPGQLFYREMSRALATDDIGQAALSLTIGGQADEGNFNFDITLNPDPSPPPTPQIQGTPETGAPSIGGITGLQPIAPPGR